MSNTTPIGNPLKQQESQGGRVMRQNREKESLARGKASGEKPIKPIQKSSK